jgi:flagellar hook-associated protein 3 FlgL
MGDITRNQQNLFELQGTISSGLKTKTFSGLSGSVELFVDLESKIRKSQRFIENIAVATGRINTTNTVLDQTIKVAEDTRAVITQWRSSNKDVLSFIQQIDGLKDSLKMHLNTNIEGRFLLGGTRTNVPPVKDLIPEPLSVGTPDAEYYQGSADDITFRASDSMQLSYNVRADEPAFQKVFAAFAQAKEAHTNGDSSAMANAFNLISEGLEGIIYLQTQNNVNKLTIEDARSTHQTLQAYYRGQSEALINTDIVAATTDLAFKQSMLQASYQAFARMNELKLSDFLR